MLRWIVVGIGDIARRRVIPAIQSQPGSRLFGVVSRSREKGLEYSERVWPSLEEALAAPGFDAVYIATPVVFQGPQTIKALRAGKHVLCEKPMAMNYTEACAMQRAADESGRILGVAYYRRMYPKIGRARELLAEGVIGRPVLAEINCHGWFDDAAGPRGWLLDQRMAGGGPLFDVGSHRIDILNYLFGKPSRVSGHLSNLLERGGGPSTVEDAATVLIEYETGVRGIVDVRWHSRVDRDEFRIVGTEGEIRLSPLNGPRIEWTGGAEDYPPHRNLHYPCVENFVDAVEGRASLAASGATSMVTDWVTEQVTRSNPL